MTTCLIVPCYNEAERLPVEQFASFVGRHPDIHFCFVDDGSKDHTHEIIVNLCLRFGEQLSSLRLDTNSGKAEAVRQGLLFVLDRNHDRVGYWDADLATPLNTILDLNKVLDEKPEVELAMGARVKLMGRKIVRREFRHYAGRIFATMASMVLRLPAYDTQCGAKILRVHEHTKNIFECPFISRWIFDVELIVRLVAQWKRGKPEANIQARIYEYPLHEWVDIDGSKIRFKDFLRAGIDLFKIKWRY